jgi:(2Fe-2S) ferredoxin
MDTTLYLVSAQYVSAGRFAALARTLEATAPGIAKAIRLEGEGKGLWAALDDLAASGAARITLRPIGLPFSESLERWLPGAAGSWLAARGGQAPTLLIADPVQSDPEVVAAAARATVTLRPIAPRAGGHHGKGWDMPPAARHHILICAGPRCHAQDAPDLAALLKQEIAREKLSDHCLVTTTGCLFPCNKGPSLVHYPAGHWYRIPDASALRRFVSEALLAGRIPTDLHYHTTGVVLENV